MDTVQPAAITRKKKSKFISTIDTFICCICGYEIPKSEIIEINGKYLCSTCYCSEKIICESLSGNKN